MPNKTIMDAVNDLRGDLNNTNAFKDRDGSLYYSLLIDRYVTSSSLYRGNNGYICTVDEFNARLDELETNFGTSCTIAKYKHNLASKHKSKSKAELLVEHLESIEKNFTKSLKAAYFSGFNDGRDPDYLGCDVLARWESSDIKREIKKGEGI